MYYKLTASLLKEMIWLSYFTLEWCSYDLDFFCQSWNRSIFILARYWIAYSSYSHHLYVGSNHQSLIYLGIFPTLWLQIDRRWSWKTQQDLLLRVYASDSGLHELVYDLRGGNNNYSLRVLFVTSPTCPIVFTFAMPMIIDLICLPAL